MAGNGRTMRGAHAPTFAHFISDEIGIRRHSNLKPLQHTEASCMYIERVTVENVKSYRRKTTVTLNRYANIFIGPNGGGKSNLLSALGVAFSQLISNRASYGEDATHTSLSRDSSTPTTMSPEAYRGTPDQPFSLLMTVKLEDTDKQNIDAICALDSEQLNRFRVPDQVSEFISFIRLGHSFIPDTIEIAIIDGTIKYSSSPSSIVFEGYLTHYWFLRTILEQTSSIVLSPPLLYLGPSRQMAQLDLIDIGAANPANYLSTFGQIVTSPNHSHVISNLLQLFLGRCWLQALTEAGYTRGGDKTPEEILYGMKVIDFLRNALRRIGFDLQLKPRHRGAHYIDPLLKKGESRIAFDQLSTGEREIIALIFFMAAAGVRDSVLILDEPELHLHPKLTAIMSTLMFEYSRIFNVQFAVATHSQNFISGKTLRSVHRVYSHSGSSNVASFMPRKAPSELNLAHIIRSHNNEGLFFADFVLLVEGISDRLVFATIVDAFFSDHSEAFACTVLDVQGKSQFMAYKNILDALEVRHAIIADADYLINLRPDTANLYFTSKKKKVDDFLWNDKKSRDKGRLVDALKSAIAGGDVAGLSQILDAVESRFVRKRSDLNAAEEEAFQSELRSLQAEGIFLLPRGEVEDYLPSDARGLNELVQLLSNPGWTETLESSARRDLLALFDEVSRFMLTTRSASMAEAEA
jgi:putative ATP-dependent endonuclease of the OLD family